MARSVPIDAFSPEPVTREVGPFRFFDGSFGAAAVLPSHYHDCASVFVIVSGALCERFSRRAYECEPGTALMKPAGERHADIVSHAGVRAVAVEFVDEPAVSGDGGAIPHDVRASRDPWVGAIARRIARELRTNDLASRLALEGLALELAALRLRERDEARAGSPSWLLALRDRLAEECDRTHRVADLARSAGRNPAYVARAFRERFGCSIGTFLRRARVESAARMIASTDEPLASIALRWGFADQSHFCRAFRRQMGLTPAAFRSESHGEGATKSDTIAPPRNGRPA